MAHGTLAECGGDPPAAIDCRQRADLAHHRREAARLRMHAQGLSWRPGAAPDAVRRDASVRTGDRVRTRCADRGAGSPLSSAAHGPFEVWTGPDRAHGSRLADGAVFGGLLDAANPGFWRNWRVPVCDRQRMDWG